MASMKPFTMNLYNVVFGCENKYRSVTSKGYFQGDDPMQHPLIVMLIQLGTALVMTTIMRRILQALHQPRFIAEMLTGILLGPSILQHFSDSKFFEYFYTAKQTAMMSFFEFFSIFMFTYILGMQIDFSVIKRTGKLGWILGLSAFILPNIMTKISSTFVSKYNPKGAADIEQIAMFSPITAYPVIVLLLQDIKLLNSEIGRLAISSSLISSSCSYIYTTGKSIVMLGTYFNYTTWDYMKTTAPRILLVLFIVFVPRPIMYWLQSKIPEGKLKQWHFVAMIMMLFAVGLSSEILGYSALLGAKVLGLCVPPGPPLGSGMISKANLFVTSVLVPSYLLVVGNSVNIFLMDKLNFWSVLTVEASAALGKIFAAVVPMRVLGVPYKDSFALGLILSSQGLFDVITGKRMLSYMQINEETFTVVAIMIMLNVLIATPILTFIYDPSKRYINYKRRTIQHSRNDTELKVLVCTHEEDDIFGIMKTLKAIYPTKSTPVIMYAIDLMELVGQFNPVLINHQFHQRRSPTAPTNRTERILSAFQQFEDQHEGLRRSNFTAIAPYDSMHDEICTLALEKSVSLVIIPFHKFETVPMRGVKRNMLDKAPCSIGILMDKSTAFSRNGSSLAQCFHVCVVFLGGPDSREALGLAMHMLENPSTRVTLIRLIAEDEFVSDMLETKLDVRAVMELKGLYGDEGTRVLCKEVMVKDGAHTIEVLRSIDHEYDFILVGRRLEDKSPLVSGLSDWTYESELGIVGDFLASADINSTAPLLVIQQQSTIEDLLHIDGAKKRA